MERFTAKDGQEYILMEEGTLNEALRRLGQFEDAYGELLARYDNIAAELEELRAAKKQKSVQFRELLGRKIIHSDAITIFRTNGVK